MFSLEVDFVACVLLTDTESFRQEGFDEDVMARGFLFARYQATTSLILFGSTVIE